MRSRTLGIPADSHGFVSFSCPHCSYRFKLRTDQVQGNDVFQLFCPSCGLSGEPISFLSEQAREAGMRLMENVAREAINESLKQFRQMRTRHVKIKTNPLPKLPDITLVEPDDLTSVTLMCCGRHVKVDDGLLELNPFCPYCGVNIDGSSPATEE